MENKERDSMEIQEGQKTLGLEGEKDKKQHVKVICRERLRYMGYCNSRKKPSYTDNKSGQKYKLNRTT